MGLECEWRHAREWWSWKFEDFAKELGVDFGLCRQTVGLSATEADIRSWGLTMMVRSWCWEFEIGLRDVGGGVSIVWYKRLLRIVSLMSKNWSQEVNKCIRTWTMESPGYLSLPIVFCISLYLYMYCCYWYHYDYGFTTIMTGIEKWIHYHTPKHRRS